MSYLAIFFCILLAIPAELQAKDIATRACEKALNKEACTSALATAPNKADKKAVCEFALNLVSSTGSEITKKLGICTNPETIRAVTDCTSSYNSAMDSIKAAQTAAASGQFPEVNIKISAAMTAATTCDTSFKETTAVSPVAALTTKFTHLCSTVLAITNA